MLAVSAFGDGELLGLGGLILAPGGLVWASCEISAAGRRYPRAVHRAGHALMQLAARSGFRQVFAQADSSIDGSGRWLLALGFRRLPSGVFLWECPAAVPSGEVG